jgi:uncharacterized protein YutE (UPF0331/DUF86 family)
MQGFLREVKALMKGSGNSQIDYYFLLSQMKSHDFFSEVRRSFIKAAGIIEESLVERYERLDRENIKLKESLKKAHQDIRDLERAKPQKEKPSSSTKFNSIKSVAENLYEKAKVLSEEEFT